MNLIRPIAKSFIYIIFLVLVTFFLIEIIFRFLPVSDAKQTQTVNQDNQIAHRKENVLATHQTGFDFSHVVEKN